LSEISRAVYVVRNRIDETKFKKNSTQSVGSNVVMVT